jgi:hypothetical protein
MSTANELSELGAHTLMRALKRNHTLADLVLARVYWVC